MTDWHQRWAEGRIGFHKDSPNPTLVEHAGLLGEGTRVLVPLCGKSVDLRWLAERGHEVVGVELVEAAVTAFFAEQGLARTTEGAVQRGGGVEIHVADILEVELAPVDAVWDRAALVALPPEVRGPYLERVLGWLKPGGRLLLVTFAYDQAKVDGPPFSVPDDEVRAALGPHGQLERLSTGRADGAPARFAEAGVDFHESVWRFTRG